MTTVKNTHLWDRAADEWYVEPKRVTEQLLRYESFDGHIHDPCCGGGNIPSVLFDAGLTVTGSDLRERAGQDPRWFAGTWDFMDDSSLKMMGAKNTIFNPPFYRAKGTEAFIRRALHLVPGKVAAFTTTTFLSGGERARGLYAETPPDRVYLITPRPSCPPGVYIEAGGKPQNGAMDWAWLVWDERSGRTELKWMI